MANDPTTPASPPQQRGCLRGCLIGLGILLAIGVIVTAVMFFYWRSLTGGMFY